MAKIYFFVYITISTQVIQPKNGWRSIQLMLEWPSQNPNLTLIEMSWEDLKQVVHVRKPTNIPEMFCMEEWAKDPSSQDLGSFCINIIIFVLFV